LLSDAKVRLDQYLIHTSKAGFDIFDAWVDQQLHKASWGLSLMVIHVDPPP
jgi:hypothetical protein